MSNSGTENILKTIYSETIHVYSHCTDNTTIALHMQCQQQTDNTYSYMFIYSIIWNYIHVTCAVHDITLVTNHAETQLNVPSHSSGSTITTCAYFNCVKCRDARVLFSPSKASLYKCDCGVGECPLRGIIVDVCHDENTKQKPNKKVLQRLQEHNLQNIMGNGCEYVGPKSSANTGDA